MLTMFSLPTDIYENQAYFEGFYYHLKALTRCRMKGNEMYRIINMLKKRRQIAFGKGQSFWTSSTADTNRFGLKKL